MSREMCWKSSLLKVMASLLGFYLSTSGWGLVLPSLDLGSFPAEQTFWRKSPGLEVSFGLFLSQKTVSLEPGFHGLASREGFSTPHCWEIKVKVGSRMILEEIWYEILSWLQALRSVLFLVLRLQYSSCSYYVRTFMGSAAGVSGSPGGSVNAGNCLQCRRP